MNYLEIFKRFNELKTDYLVVGGLAVNFHGIPRMTYDIDIMIHLTKKNILKLVIQLTEWGYKPKVRVDVRDLADSKKRRVWMKEKGMKAFNFYHDKFAIAEIDIVLYSPLSYRKLRKNAVFVDLSGEKIPTISIQDLIYVKSKAGRRQDLSDVEHLKELLK